MLPGSTLIVACPTCGFLMTQQTWLSYSHWGGESWSDGSWSDRGLNPICSEVSKCKGCDNFFWVEDVKVKKTLKFTLTHLRKKYKNIPSIEALTLEELCENDGSERWIEVKTTNYGKSHPFLIEWTEVQCSIDNPNNFHLYRVFNFKNKPELYILSGSVEENFELKPKTFSASK